MKALVFSESISMLLELISAAKSIGADAEVCPIVIGTGDDADRLSKVGVSKVLWLGEGANRLIDDYVPTISALVSGEAPDMFLVGATIRGKAVAARVAARLGTSAVVNAKSIENGCVTHDIYGGGARRAEKLGSGKTLVATMTLGCAAPAAVGPVIAPVVNVAYVAPEVEMRLVESAPRKAGSTDIASAKRVVGAGRGFFDDEDLKYAKELAEAVGGAVGYSRPVIELGLPSLEGEPYIGISGIQVKPDLYVAVAVSGQTQHVVGVNEAKRIVCINKDKEARMFKLSDYGVVGDYKEVIPALVAAIREEKSK